MVLIFFWLFDSIRNDDDYDDLINWKEKRTWNQAQSTLFG